MDELSSTIAELRCVISSHAYKHTPYITVRKEVIYPLLDRLTTLSSSESGTAKTAVLQPSTNVPQCDGTDSSRLNNVSVYNEPFMTLRFDDVYT